jgi:hypothetical protein
MASGRRCSFCRFAGIVAGILAGGWWQNGPVVEWATFAGFADIIADDIAGWVGAHEHASGIAGFADCVAGILAGDVAGVVAGVGRAARGLIFSGNGVAAAVG